MIKSRMQVLKMIGRIIDTSIHGHEKFKLGYVPVFGYWGRWQRLALL